MEKLNRKVIITGATGLIGKEALEPLKKLGFEIFALSRDKINSDSSDPELNWIKCDLFDSTDIKTTFEKIKPSFLLNFAWKTTGDYLESNINFDFLKVGLDLLKYFNENGGKRAVFAGTCFEYQYKETPLKENDPPDPQAVYSKCKNYLRELASLFCLRNNISFGWGRVFYVFGINEHIKRLSAHAIDNFQNDKEVIINNGELIRAYMFSKDIAAAFVKFLDSSVEGIVNICPGNGISLGDFASKIARKLGKTNLLKILKEPVNQPKIIVGDNTRLIQEVEYKLQYDYDKAIDEILSFNNKRERSK
ncbi:MAG: NAD-dependent epimerase/dehydratase family protein [Elusimicrobiota bacterium]|jgi:nucleoside-diphosphate-sugar epimerase|nr:NAD-dependent epimerase/dehydratase family protein [Elusimicrobiota bacterium]